MNYWVLKWMLDSLIKTYKCEWCNCSTTEENVSIIWAAGKTVNINIECKKCKKNSMVKMEIVWIDLTKLNISKNKLNQINSKIRDLGLLKNKSLENIEEGEMILDEEIINLSRELKWKSFKVDDLFKN